MDSVAAEGNALAQRDSCWPACTLQTGGSQPAAGAAVEATGGACSGCDPAAPCEAPCGRLTEFWDPELLQQLSHHPAIERCHALGGCRVFEHKCPLHLFLRTLCCHQQQDS